MSRLSADIYHLVKTKLEIIALNYCKNDFHEGFLQSGSNVKMQLQQLRYFIYAT